MARRLYSEPTVTAYLRLPETLAERLQEAADRLVVSKNLLVNRAIEHYLDTLTPIEELVRAAAVATPTARPSARSRRAPIPKDQRPIGRLVELARAGTPKDEISAELGVHWTTLYNWLSDAGSPTLCELAAMEPVGPGDLDVGEEPPPERANARPTARSERAKPSRTEEYPEKPPRDISRDQSPTKSANGRGKPRSARKVATVEELIAGSRKRREFGSTTVRCANCGEWGRTNVKLVGKARLIDRCANCR